MDKIVKLNSKEGGPYTTSQNRISFEIPDDGVYDLSMSHINLNVLMSSVDSDPASGEGVYPTNLFWNETDSSGNRPNYPNVCLVKNAVLRSTNKGTLENIRRVDQLKALLSNYNSSVEEVVSDSYKSSTSTPSPMNDLANEWGIYHEINKTGNVVSKVNQNVPIMIPLSDLFDFCFQAFEYDTTKAGKTSVNCELNVDKLTALFTGQPFQTGISEMEDLTSGGDQDVVLTENIITNLNQSPYFVGQKVRIQATGNGGASNLDEKEVIKSIEWLDTGANKGKLQITFQSPFANLGTGESFTDVSLEKVDPGSVSFSLNFGEMVLVKKAMASSSIDVIKYRTYSTEQTNGNGLISFQNQYQVEPECDAVIITFPQNTDNLISVRKDIENIRLRLDNEDLTDRDYNVRSALYFDKINMTMTQLRLRMKSLKENYGNSVQTWNTFYDDTAVCSIMNPLVQKTREKLLQINTENSAIGELSIFKSLPRNFEY